MPQTGRVVFEKVQTVRVFDSDLGEHGPSFVELEHFKSGFAWKNKELSLTWLKGHQKTEGPPKPMKVLQ